MEEDKAKLAAMAAASRKRPLEAPSDGPQAKHEARGLSAELATSIVSMSESRRDIVLAELGAGERTIRHRCCLKFDHELGIHDFERDSQISQPMLMDDGWRVIQTFEVTDEGIDCVDIWERLNFLASYGWECEHTPEELHSRVEDERPLHLKIEVPISVYRRLRHQLFLQNQADPFISNFHDGLLARVDL